MSHQSRKTDSSLKDPEQILNSVLEDLRSDPERYFKFQSAPHFKLLERQKRRLSDIWKYLANSNGNNRYIYIKIHKNPEHKLERIREFCDNEFEILSKLDKAFDAHLNHSVVKVLGYFPEYLTIVTEEVKGENLFLLLKKRSHLLASREEFGKLSKYCYNCGEWLSIFQSLTKTNRKKKLSEFRLLEKTVEDLERLGALGLNLKNQDQTLRYMEERLKKLGDVIIEISGQHGDFIPFNALVKLNKTAFLDFPYFTEGSVYHDLARFCTVLVTMSKNPIYRLKDMDELMTSFLDGFQQNSKLVHDIFLRALIYPIFPNIP